MPIKENHNFRVATFLPSKLDIQPMSRLKVIRTRTEIADEITEWSGSYSYHIHSQGTRLDFWFEHAEDAMLFELSYL